MGKWKSYCLGEIAKIKYGKNQKKVQSADGKFPIYGTGGFMGYADKFLYDKSSVLIGRKGSISKVKFVDKPFWTVDTLFYTEINESLAIPKFLYYFLSLTDLYHYNEGTTIPSLRTETLNQLEIKLPPLETQKKIVAVLSALDDKIELNNAINKNLEEQAQAIYKNMFVDNFSPAWRKCRADEVFNISIGKTPPRKEHQWFTQDSKDITWVSISDMGSCGVYIGRSSEYLTAEAVKKFNVRKVPRNTVILSFKLTVGRVAITDRELTTNEAIAHFVTEDSFMTEYLYLYLKNFSYQTMGSTSSIATAINSKIIKAMSFILPTEEELCTFHDLIEPLFLMILQNQHENQKLGEIRDALLPRLMSGEIDVSAMKI